MEKIFKWSVKHKNTIVILYVLACIVSIFCRRLITVNYDIKEYLPNDTPSTVAMEVMEQEFSGGIPNARLMVSDVSIPQALELKKKLLLIDGVSAVMWLDDAANTAIPIETLDTETVQAYYRDSNALFSITLDSGKFVDATRAIEELAGDNGYMAGTAVNIAVATTSTQNEIRNIILIAVPFCLLILLITTTSWFEPVLLLSSIGAAIILNAGTNLIFGEISFVTNAAGNILQLAVSLDYSVFLLHRFEEYRQTGIGPEEAMGKALKKTAGSITSSGLTTIIGFAALILMRFRLGPDLGLALAKGVCFSLLSVFTLLPVMILLCYKVIDKTRHRPLTPEFNGLGKFITKSMIPMAIVFCVVMAPAYLAQINNDFYYGASKIFGEETKLGRDTKIIEDTFGKSVTYVLMVPRGNLTLEKQLSEELQAIPQVTGVISYVDTVGAEIPIEFLDGSVASNLISENYSRMILNMESDYENEEAFGLVEQVRDTANRYYPDSCYLLGESVSTYDLRDVIIVDNIWVNLIAIAAIFIVLLISFKSLTIPVILVLAIETAIWLNQAFPYFSGSPLFYIGYLIISSVQLGATVDYAILLTSRYLEYRETNAKLNALRKTVSAVTASILTSGIAMTVIGFLLGYLTTHGLLSQLGMLLGRGTLLSMIIVLFVLPGLLYIADKPIEKTTFHARFYKEEMDEESSDAELLT